ncbi:MAG: hypothetical protein ABR971_05180 [Acidobacteriaceae bacterium]
MLRTVSLDRCLRLQVVRVIGQRNIMDACLPERVLRIGIATIEHVRVADRELR